MAHDMTGGRKLGRRGSKNLPVSPADGIDWGPAMRALNDRQRTFVLALYEVPPGYGAHVAAAKLAGYECSTPESWATVASRLYHDDRIQAALREHDEKVLRATAPRAIRALHGMVEDPEHKDHARAVGMVLDRVHPVETRHHITSEHRHVLVVDKETALKRIAEIAARVGMDPAQAARLEPIDAEYEDVTEEGETDAVV